MNTLLPTITIIIAISLIAITVILWFWRSVRITRKPIFYAIIALLLWQLLKSIEGSYQIPQASAPTLAKTIALLALLSTFNSLLILINWLINEHVLNRFNIRVPRIIIDAFTWVVFVAVALLAYRYVFQVSLTGLVVTSTVASAIIGFSLQDVLGNLFSGIVLQVDPPYLIGDWVNIEGQEGVITEQNWRSLRLQTREDHVVILPNSQVAKGRIDNFSQPTDLQALIVPIGVSYASAPGDVKAVLMQATKDSPYVVDLPEPIIFLTGYNDFSIDYEVKFWIRAFDKRPIIEDDVLSRFWYALKRNDMHIPFPIRDVNLRTITAADTQNAAQKQRLLKTRFMRTLPFLNGLSDEQLTTLSTATVAETYTKGETLMHEGEQGDSLFIIETGELGIFVDDEKIGRTHVDTQAVGNFIGEMSLLTGEPRTATVMATEETKVLMINKEHFVGILAADPTILEPFTNAVAHRRKNEASERDAAAKRHSANSESEQGDLLKRVRGFLGV